MGLSFFILHASKTPTLNMSSPSVSQVGGVNPVFGLSNYMYPGPMPMQEAYGLSMPISMQPQTSTLVSQGRSAPESAIIPRLHDEDVFRIAIATKSLLAEEMGQNDQAPRRSYCNVLQPVVPG